MKWSSAVSENFSIADAVEETASNIHEELGDVSPDLIVAFVSSHHSANYDKVPGLIHEFFGDVNLIGCSGGGIIGAGQEIEHRPGFSITAASLPNVTLKPFHIQDNQLPDGDAPPDMWENLVNVMASDSPNFILLADPFSISGEQFLMGLDFAFPKSVKIGGLASGGQQPGGNALYLQDKTHSAGVAGLAMYGDIVLDTIVAQGCRPIGQPMHVTDCRRNVLMELDGRTPFEVLKEVFEGLTERDRELAQHSLFLGVVMDELTLEPKLGDFLIRNIVGVDPRQGVIAVGEMLKEGQTVQFHLRDANTSSEDLDQMLTNYISDRTAHEESGALLFSCLGRGSYLYGRADHDTDMFREKVGELPLTGFFCNGEIGQVGGSTFLHGYTSSFGIFRPKQTE